MRLRHADGTPVHLGYCTNVHPAEDLDGIISQLEQYAGPVRERLGADVLGLGLWLAHQVAGELAGDATMVTRLRAELAARGLEVVTLNGFPYRSFHAPVVKQAVYHPDWTRPERLQYTLDLATVLSGLLPGDARHGSVSTLPLAWREPWDPARRAEAGRKIRALESGLADLAVRTGRTIRVGFEPEPGCVVETVDQIERELAGFGGGPGDPLLGVCLDACHLAVGFEDPVEVLHRLATAELPVVKLQASCALQADHPGDPAVRGALTSFAEPRFLHQTRATTPRLVSAADDLPEALTGPTALPNDAVWRVHFHVPLHAPPAPPLTSTSGVLLQTLAGLFGGPAPLTDHVEVETYTWSVLPTGQRPETAGALVAGIAAEVAWARDALVRLGLKEESA